MPVLILHGLLLPLNLIRLGGEAGPIEPGPEGQDPVRGDLLECELRMGMEG